MEYRYQVEKKMRTYRGNIFSLILHLSRFKSTLMENQQIEQLHNLSWDEKFEIIQMLWNDLADNPEKLHLPEEHKNILRKRIERIESGEAKFKPWHEIKAKYLPA